METKIHKWSVAWICCFINFLYLGVPRLSGMFYLAAITRYHVNRNQAALPFVLCYTVRNVAGPFIGCLSRKVKVETLILCGCMLSSVGVGVCFFAEDITAVSILWGGIFGLGFGLSTVMIPSVLNQHFDKYISNANGIAFGGECIAGFVLPPLYDFCLNTFGPSGSFLILSGLLLHGIPAAMLLRPPDKKAIIAQRNRNSIENKWDSWLSIDKAGCSGENTYKRGREKQVHEDGVLYDKNEVKSLLYDSKNCYGTSNIAIAIQKNGGLGPLNESSPSLNSSKLDYKHLSSDQYGILNNETLPNSKLSSCFREKNASVDSNDERFHHENIENAIQGEASGSVPDVIMNNEASPNLDSNYESTHPRTGLSSDEKTPTSELSLQTKSPCVSSDSFSYKKNPHDNSKAAKLKETDQNEHCNEASQNFDTSLHKSPCVTSITPSIFQDSGGPSTDPPKSRLPDIPSESNNSTRPCCPPTCSVFFDPAFLLILFTQSSSIFVATTFTTILVDFSIDAGVDPTATVYILMCFSAADMAGRFGLGWVTDGAWLSGVAFSALCFGVMGAVLLTAPVAYQGFALVTVAVGVYGAVLGGLIVIGPVVVSDHFEEGTVNVALASRLALFAPMSLLQSPMIGYFRDTLGSYNGILYLLGLLCMACAVLCLLIPSAARCRKVEFQERDVAA